MARNERFENKILAAMGAFPSALEALDRSDFASDDEYIEACIDYDLAHNDPQRATLRRQYARLLNEQKEQEADAAQAARLDAIRGGTRLTDGEAAEIECAAALETVDAIRAGKVEAADFTAAKAKAVDRLTAAAINRKASGEYLNQMLREDYERSRGIDEQTAQRMSQETITSLTGGNTGNNAY